MEARRDVPVCALHGRVPLGRRGARDGTSGSGGLYQRPLTASSEREGGGGGLLGGAYKGGGEVGGGRGGGPRHISSTCTHYEGGGVPSHFGASKGQE